MSRNWFQQWLLWVLVAAGCMVDGVAVRAESSPSGDMIVVLGAGGTEKYAKAFTEWADRWKAAAKTSGLTYHEVGRRTEADGENDRDILQSLLIECQAAKSEPLWVVLIGHGTYDRYAAKFNLKGPDFSAKELNGWLAEMERPLVLINSFSTSGAFLKQLSGQNRVVVTATKSGLELNYSRFGGYLASALSDPEADLDHDEQVSLLEAYLLAAAKVARFYEEQSRLATEHALLEDNQDGKGTPADFFVGIRVEKKAKDNAAPDGRLAHRYILVPSSSATRLSTDALARRDELELKIDDLRGRKSRMSLDAYYGELEPLLVDMARLYEKAATEAKSSSAPQKKAQPPSQSDD